MLTLFSKITKPLNGPVINRQEACNLCETEIGLLLAMVDYWDIRSSNIVKCPNCGLIQLDPMLSQKETALGCLAFYLERSRIAPAKEQKKNLVRNFRRGIHFARKLKNRGFHPGEVLEIRSGFWLLLPRIAIRLSSGPDHRYGCQ